MNGCFEVNSSKVYKNIKAILKYTTVYLVAIKQSEQELNKCVNQVSDNPYLENKNPEILKLVMVVSLGNIPIRWV